MKKNRSLIRSNFFMNIKKIFINIKRTFKKFPKYPKCFHWNYASMTQILYRLMRLKTLHKDENTITNLRYG